jgi:hypothetical protein
MDLKVKKIIREGSKNRNQILDAIRKNETIGITPGRLKNTTNFSRQTIQAHLKILSLEGKIYKTKVGKERRYFPQNSLLNDVELYAFSMADRLMAMIDKGLVPPLEQFNFLESIPDKQPLYQYPDIDFTQTNPNPSAHSYFLKAMSGTSPSEVYCETRFADDNIIESNLFEFVNRVGAYIAFIFIESLRPVSDEKAVTENAKKVRTRYLVKRSFPIERLFRKFCLLLNQLEIIDSHDSSPVPEKEVPEEPYELSESSFERLSDSFRRVYPRVYEALENFWFNSRVFHLKRSSLFASYSKCNHKWEKYNLYRIGSCYVCLKCHLLSEERIRSKIS